MNSRRPTCPQVGENRPILQAGYDATSEKSSMVQSYPGMIADELLALYG